jgi:hypothetical protein
VSAPTEIVPGLAAATGPARGRASIPVQVARILAVVVALVLVAAVVNAVRMDRDDVALSARNPSPDGAQAAAEILRDQGVDVQRVDDLDRLLSLADGESTVLVTAARLLDPAAAEQIAATGADLVLVGPTDPVLDAIGAPVESIGGGSTDPVQAECADDDALAATRIGEFRGALEPVGAGPGAETCFPGSTGGFAYATWQDDDGARRVLSDGSLLSNDRLDEDGHAALVLRALGHHETVQWFAPTAPVAAIDPDGGSTPADALSPAWWQMVGWAAALAVLVLALALGRNLGPVLREPMPVVVRSAETVRGRGALYRRGGSRAHAGAGLRAGCAARIGRRLGLPPSAHPSELVEQAARASGRSEAWVRDLLYGAPPSTGRELTALATDLDTLESEVHRP